MNSANFLKLLFLFSLFLSLTSSLGVCLDNATIAGKRCYQSMMGWPGNNGKSPGYNTSTCFENSDGTFNTCINSFTPTAYTYAGKVLYTGVTPNVNITVYRMCSLDCPTCIGINNPDYNCTSCRTGLYLWVGYNRCRSYCPSLAISASGFLTTDIGQYPSTGNQCAQCDMRCNFCNGPSLTNCFSCRAGYYQVGDYAECMNRYNTTPYGNENTCYTTQCYSIQNQCPPYYYYVAQSIINDTTKPFYSWSIAVCQSNGYDATCVQYRRTNQDGVCYLCDSHCQTCTGLTQLQCVTCSRYNYLWAQKANYCQQTCPRGVYTSNAGDWVGQFVNETAVNVTTGIGDRKCYLCNSNCRWCRYSAQNCIQCKDNFYLIDLVDECKARYITPNNCSVCMNTTIDMCNNAAFNTNKRCVSTCPTYLYFALSRTAVSSSKLSVQYAMYSSYMTATESYLNGNRSAAFTAQTYRLGTNLCMLCDYRCIQCTGPYNNECSMCRSGFYKWMTAPICDTTCPSGQYQANDEPYPVNQTECRYCSVNCIECALSKINCTSCVGANYAFYTNNIVAFLYTYNSSYHQCLNICPAETANPSTTVGYYGSYITLTCMPCPSPCSNCNINIIRNRYPDISCGADPFCSTGLVCTSCLSGYINVGGKCISSSNCYQYQYYSAPSVGPFNPSYCYCLDGYSSATAGKCDIRCHISCKTCTSTTSTSCATCYTGYTLDASQQCVLDNTKALYTYTWVVDGPLTNIQASSTNYINCGAIKTIFGYEDQDFNALTNTNSLNKYFGYTFNIPSLNYYAIKIKIGLLFVDEYNTRGQIYVARDSNTSNPEWQWNFDTQGAYGEQLCGTNKMDYVLFQTAQLTTRNLTSQKIFIKANQDILQTTLSTQVHWGITGFLVTVLSCDPACSRCTGPSSTQCLICANTGYIAINGTCLCDIDNNYYKWANGICNMGCPTGAGWFRNNYTRSCVQPPTNSNCTAPYRLGDSMGVVGYGSCVSECPSGLFATYTYMKCTTDCWLDGPNHYKYSGGQSGTCQSICPSPYIKDPSTHTCVLKCPASSYLQIQNSTTDPICVTQCPTGYQFDGLQACVSDCPGGTFKYETNPTNPTLNHKKCVTQCINSFGDPTTSSCTLSCPFPTYGDPRINLCLDTCSYSTDFMQVRVSDLNRTCVPTCEPGQYGNPYTLKCSNYTTSCPDGFYADSHTHMCQPNCTTAGEVGENSTKACQTSCSTGFAHWQSRKCVAICPSDPSMFGYLPTRICVYNCNYTTTQLYGDSQANRTCVQTCTASPSPTYGQNSTSLCVSKCSGSSQFGDAGDIYRRCVTSCSNVPMRYAQAVSRQCVLTCPTSYYGDIDPVLLSGVCAQACQAPNFGDPITHTCRATCKAGYYGNPNGARLCVAVCPRYWFGINGTTTRLCVQVCDDGYWGDVQTSMCYNVKTSCSNNTYADAQRKLCVNAIDCTLNTFADPFTKGCQASCSNGYFADSHTRSCVPMCFDQFDEYGQWGVCRYNCLSNQFADAQANRTCQASCSRSPLALFGLVAARRMCVLAQDCPTDYYGDNTTLTCVNLCTGSFPFADPISKQCVIDCPDGWWGDYDLHKCVQVCNSATFHFADNITGNCQTLCSIGTFGVNVSSSHPSPTCQLQCPPGAYGRDTDRLCVAVCGASYYSQPITKRCYLYPTDCPDGYYGSISQHLCVVPQNCQTDAITGKHYFADNSTKTCVAKCPSPAYGDSALWLCVSQCNTTYFGENSTRLCLADCSVDLNSYAETQNNLCVARCSNTPLMHYAEDVTHTCVIARDCPYTTSQTYAQNSTQKCVLFCGANQYADIQSYRCVATCPNGYYADDSTGITLCSATCPGTYRYKDNSTRSCVNVCPATNSTFGYSDGDACVYVCPTGFYAQDDVDRRCVSSCKTGTWANKQTRTCTAQPLTGCPEDTWADNSTSACEPICDTASGYYGENSTRMCVTACPSGSFAQDATRVCIDLCPALLSGYGYFGDPSTLPTRKCFMNCQTAGLYRDSATRTCVSTCTYNSTYKTYKDPTTMNCQSICSTYPQQRYADDNLISCQLQCAGTLIKDDLSQKCVSVCTGVYQPTTDKCIDKCPTESSLGEGLFANLDATLNTCVTAANCPANTYADADSRTCVSVCPSGYYSSGKYCVYFCPIGQYGDSSTNACVIPANCPANTYADNQTQTCVSKCIGTYGDPVTKRCVLVCQGTYFGDSYTRQCVTNCSQGFKANQITRTCTSDCGSVGTYLNTASGSCIISCPSPYFEDDSIMACVLICPASPMLYASVSSTTGARKCVQTCQPGKWYDMLNRICVDSCPVNTYILAANSSCVTICPAPQYYQLGSTCVTNCSSDPVLQFGDDLTRRCVSTCPPGSYSNPLTYICTDQCPLIPVQYYISVSESKCTTLCPQGTFADPRSYVCVTQCSINPRMYAQDVNNVCVDVCPFSSSSFADPTTGKCVLTCPSGYFADSRDRTCKSNCSYLFSDSVTTPPACVENCSSGTYADQITYTCLSQCPKFYFKFPPQNICVSVCPFGYFLNPDLSLCVTGSNCPSTLPYADSLTHKCTNVCSQQQFGYLPTGASMGGSCVLNCPGGLFSNPITGKCVVSCPDGLFADTDSYTCNQKCTYDKLMDEVNNQCVLGCSPLLSLYADLFDRKCVTQCNTPVKQTYADDLTRNCQTLCTGSQYGDPPSGKCVGAKQCSTGLLSDWRYKKCMASCNDGAYGYLGQCVAECPSLTDGVYGSRQGNLCVPAINCPTGTYGDPVLKICVQFCPLQSDTFANQATKQCLVTCNPPLFGQIKTRYCMPDCPNVPKMFGDPVSRRCVYSCQPPYFADQISNLCVLGCPQGYFSYTVTSTCVKECPEGSFANKDNLKCQFTCSLPYYGDNDLRKCVPTCPSGQYGDADNNRECHPSCTGNINTYAENTTQQCVGACLTGFSNPRTKQCIGVCTAGYFGYGGVCYQNCPVTTPQVYADNVTHTCVQNCPSGTFADGSTLKCVKICPISNATYGDPQNWVCTTACSGTYYADPSSRLCVPVCPQVPALYGQLPEQICVPSCPVGLYADNSTRTCSTGCPLGTYADNTTYKCQFQCPLNPLMFGQNITNTCVKYCWVDRDMYADNLTGTCVYMCSLHTFADPTTHKCVVTCPSGYFAANDTRRCEPVCPAGSFANQFLRICVAMCPIDPVYYGDNADHLCKTQCPPGSYGNPVNQQCAYDVNGVSTCPPNYFADALTKICVQICSRQLVLYGDPTYKKCMPTCSPGLFYDDSTMRCVVKCPKYPNYYGNLVGMRCIWPCPNGTYADDQSKVCMSSCSPNSYADDTTWRCVQKCPYEPLTFGDSLSWTCVSACPSGYFADNSTHTCVQSCPAASQHTFADNNTGTCVKICPSSTFADYSSGFCVSQCYGTNYSDIYSRMCVSQCPSYPASYGDPSTNKCVSTCPAFYYTYEPTRLCVLDCPDPTLYRQNSTSSCVAKCDWPSNTYADNLTRYCVPRCSANSWAESISRICVLQCPIYPILTYADNSSQSCVPRCPGLTLGVNSTRMCVNTCPSSQFTYSENNLCVKQCPSGYFAQSTKRCVVACASPQFGDPSTKYCVPVCPLSENLFADNSTRTCVASCPPFTYADRRSISCVSVCPDANPSNFQLQTYAADYNGQCVQYCSSQYYAFLPTKSCITLCPNPYYNDNITHTCQLCPVACTACPIPQFCTGCVAGYWWQNGNCIQFCSQGYYGNQTSMKCVPSAMCAPYYGVNSTRLCTVTCPPDTYKNQQFYRCDACFYTCLTCTYWDYCLTCNISISFMSNNMCYEYCEINDFNGNGVNQPYFNVDNKTCTQTCPDGTYLSAVYCRKCAETCETCSMAATNCTRCKDGLYLKNYVCVDVCNDGYKPTTTRDCVFCGSTCGAELTFTSNTTKIKGENVVFVKFSSNIRILGDPNYIFILVKTARRRLLAAGYTIYLVDDNTIKIVLDSSMNYNKYTLKIVQPEKILDDQGNMPDRVRDLIIIDLTESYNMTLENAPTRFSDYFAFLSVICVLSFLFDIQFMKFLQLIYVHYFVAMSLPPEFSKVLMAFRYSMLYYLPTIYPVPEAQLRQNLPTKISDSIGDYSFLRNGGFVFTPLLIILIIWIIMKILSVPQINRFKKIRMWCDDQLNQKFKYAIQVQWLNIVFLNSIFFILLQTKDYGKYDNFATASIAISIIFLVFIVLALVYIGYRIVSFFKMYPSLSKNLSKAADIILKEDQYIKLNSTNIFLFQMKKIDLRNLYYPKVNNQNVMPFRNIYKFGETQFSCLFVLYFRSIIISIFIVFVKPIIVQMAFCIMLNYACFLYFVRYRPYSFKYKKRKIRNYIAIFHQIALIVFEIMMLILGVLDTYVKSNSIKQSFSYGIIAYLCIICTLSFIYFIFRIGVQIQRRIWLPITATEAFKRNFPKKWAQIHGAKSKKLMNNIDPKAKQALRALIKGYKSYKSHLRPTQGQRHFPQPQVGYKITYFDRDTSSMNTAQRKNRSKNRKMFQQIFKEPYHQMIKQQNIQYPQNEEPLTEQDWGYSDFQEYQQQIQIRVKDLASYVSNPDHYLLIRGTEREEDPFGELP